MRSRALDYCMKGLSIDVRQRLFSYMDRDINATLILQMLEKDEGYTTFHDCGFTEKQIETICDSFTERFEKANRIMVENGRPPLFSDPSDSFQSSREYMELMALRTDEELTELFGCTLESYIPPDNPMRT